MDKNTKTLKTDPKETSFIFLDQLQEGNDAHVKVMICRKWDVNTIYGKYMSTDFIVSDARGNVMHCTAKNNIAHCFIDRLQEGSVYAMGHFTVHPNKDEFRIMKDNRLMIELQGSTYVRKDAINVDGFIRYPFQCIEFEKLEPTGRKYLVDIIGYVTNVGKPTLQKNAATTLDFDLRNQRGHKIKVTLWGSLGDDLLRKKSHSCGLYAIILTSMTVKDYNRKLGICSPSKDVLSISSSTSTLIIDDAAIPALKEFKSKLSDVEVTEDNLQTVQVESSKEGTLEQLLQWARQGKNDVVSFRCQVKIANIITKSSWYYLTCSISKCKKGVTRQSGNFWCDSCDKPVSFPRIRFKLQIDVIDETAQTVIIMFDETAEKLVGATSQSLLDAMNQDSEDSVLPNAITNLINTTHILELKAHTYYQHGSYESFNCSNVYPAIELEKLDPAIHEDTFTDTTKAQSLSPNNLKRGPSIATPSKASEHKKRRKYVIESSESEGDNKGGSEDKKAKDYQG